MAFSGLLVTLGGVTDRKLIWITFLSRKDVSTGIVVHGLFKAKTEVSLKVERALCAASGSRDTVGKGSRWNFWLG